MVNSVHYTIIGIQIKQTTKEEYKEAILDTLHGDYPCLKGIDFLVVCAVMTIKLMRTTYLIIRPIKDIGIALIME